MRRAQAIAALAACAAAGLAGCGSPGSDATGSTSLTVYSSLPLQGPGAADARSVLNAEKLALIEAGGRVGDLTVRLVALDDSTAQRQGWDPATTAANANKALHDRTAIAYLGESDSGASAVSIPVLNATGILQVSPSSAYVGLTRPDGGQKGEPDKYFPSERKTFARLVPADDIQAEAQLAWERDRGCRRVFVVDDAGFSAKGLADQVEREAAEARADGASGPVVAGRAQVAAPKAIAGAVRDLIAARADCAFVAASPKDPAPRLLAALRRAVPSLQLFGGDAMATPAFARAVPPAVQGDLRLTSPTEDLARYTPTGRDFVASYRARFGGEPSPRAVYGYEAMKTVLVAINNAGAQGNDRGAVRKAYFAIRGRDSILGPYSIQPTGDSTLTDFGQYLVRGGRLRFERQVHRPFG